MRRLGNLSGTTEPVAAGLLGVSGSSGGRSGPVPLLSDRHSGRGIRGLAGVLLGAALLWPAAASAQITWKPSWAFRYRDYYDPVSAEPRAAQTQVLFPGRSSSFPYAVNPGQSFAWDINLGQEIPIIGWEGNRTISDHDPVPPSSKGKKQFAFGLWFPLSFHMVEDMGKDESNPILNTDYRFGGMLKAQVGLPDKWGPIQQGHIGLRYVFLAHESTHVGDEFTLAATRIYGDKFQRVNVSYEYWELGGSFEPNFEFRDKKLNRLEMKFRYGLIRPYNQQKGWYTSELLQPPGTHATPSVRNFEPYADFEAFLAPDPDKGTLGPFVSLDFRNRTVYGYNRPVGTQEQVEGSLNIMAGVRQIRAGAAIRPSYYLRYYHGVNPAGQFRSQSNYQLYGFGVMFQF